MVLRSTACIHLPRIGTPDSRLRGLHDEGGKRISLLQAHIRIQHAHKRFHGVGERSIVVRAESRRGAVLEDLQ
jgi:hypothetical protein